MKRLALIAASAAALSTLTLAPVQAASPGLQSALFTSSDRLVLDNVQYAWGGRNYCWYNSAWRGAGWYWCGYGARSGFGWGGPVGWHGWRGGYRGAGAVISRSGYHGGHHGGGYHGGGGFHGGHGGGSHGGGHGGSGHGGGGHGGGGHGGGHHH